MDQANIYRGQQGGEKSCTCLDHINNSAWTVTLQSPFKHIHLTANLHHGLKKAKNKEGSWSLASSSASPALRLQTTSLSICLIRADKEEGEQPGQ